MDTNETLLRAILVMVARQTFPPAELVKIVAPGRAGEKQISAYNMCDGRTPQSEIGKKTELDNGSLSRSISRWIEAGVVLRFGKDQHPLHLFPIPKGCSTAGSTKKAKTNE